MLRRLQNPDRLKELIGDGIDTDIRGAVAQGIDVLFVTGGIHATVFGDREAPDLAAIHAFLATAGLGARALMKRLVWAPA